MSEKSAKPILPIAFWRPLRAAALLLILLLVLAGPAAAEGPGTGGSRIFLSDEVVGGYSLIVWAGPSPPQVGRYTVYVRATDAAGGQQLRDGLTVSVQSVEESTGAILTSDANHTNAGNSLDYAAHLELPRQGNYDFTVNIDGPRGPAQVTFRDRVVGTITFGLISAIAGPFIVLIGAVFWYMWARKSEEEQGEGGQVTG